MNVYGGTGLWLSQEEGYLDLSLGIGSACGEKGQLGG